MDSRIIDILRYSFLVIALLIGLVFVNKYYRQHVAKKEIVAELQSITTDSSFYRQFEASEAHATLLRSVALIQQANDLGLSQTELFDRVFQHDKMDDFGGTPSMDYPIKEKLARNTLTSAYESAKRLQMLDVAALRDLKDGRMPLTLEGTPVILPLIDPELSPGLEKVLPNLEILPSDHASSDRHLTAIETAAARRLADDLASSGLIENTVAERIVEHYKTLKKESLKESD